MSGARRRDKITSGRGDATETITHRGCAMNGQTKLIFPGLAGFYDAVLPIAGTLLRVVVGIMFLMHVSGKFKIGAAAVAANIMAKNGIEPALMCAYIVIALEAVGGICLII